MTGRVLVINPSSNAALTQRIDAAIRDAGAGRGLHVTCEGLANAPFGPESDEALRLVAPLVASHAAARSEYDAFVIAAYPDPGLAETRTLCRKPVLGIQESAITLCAAHGRRFGVLALDRDSVQRDIAYVRQLGLQAWHAGERFLGLSFDQAASDPQALGRIVETCRQLVDEDGAENIVLGCAGLGRHRRALQQALGVPVIDPVEAALSMVAEMLGAQA